MSRGSGAIKNSERNHPVRTSIRLRKEATAPTIDEFEVHPFDCVCFGDCDDSDCPGEE